MSKVTVEHLAHPSGCFWILKVGDTRFYWWSRPDDGSFWRATGGWGDDSFHEPRDDCKLIEHT